MAVLIRNWISGDPTLEEDIEFLRSKASALFLGLASTEVGRDCAELPQNIKDLRFLNCMFHVRSLVDTFALIDGYESVIRLTIIDCRGIQYVWGESSCSALENLEKLIIMRSSFISLTEGRIPQGPFRNLKTLKVDNCPNVERLFTPCMLKDQLGNLEIIFIVDCESLVEIFELDDDANVEFPKLRKLVLHNLPKLVSICKSGLQLCCISIKEIIVTNCKELRKLPLFGHVLGNEELSSAPPLCLNLFQVQHEWWESLVWDDPRIKQTLEPFLTYYYF